MSDSRCREITADGNHFAASDAAIDLADLMTIEDVAERLGISPLAVLALVSRSGRTIGRQFMRNTPRYYSRDDLRRIRQLLP